MKILQLCNKPPFPSVDGGCIAIKNISLGFLNNKVDLSIISVSTDKHPFMEADFPDGFIDKTNYKSVFVDTRVNVIDAFSALVTSDNYNVSRFFSSDFDKVLQETLKNNLFDIIHLESLFLTPYLHTIRKFSKAKIVLRSHNLEHLIWERLANLEGNKAKKVYLKHLASRLKKYEKQVLNDVQAIAAISSEDTNRYNQLKCTVPLKTSPFGIDLELYNPVCSKPKTSLKLFHIGSMDWSPNIEAVNWFLDDIFPKLSKLNCQLSLAGKNMPNYILKQKSDKLNITGYVKSAIDFIADNDVMIVPLLSGSGMRIKIIEAMAMGKTVITTKIGLEGIAAVHGKHVLIANTTKEFKKEIEKLIDNPDLVVSIGKNARNLVENNYDNKVISKELLTFYETLI
jgi:glycosyltransferase involved in cell wall biosynthesis